MVGLQKGILKLIPFLQPNPFWGSLTDNTGLFLRWPWWSLKSIQDHKRRLQKGKCGLKKAFNTSLIPMYIYICFPTFSFWKGLNARIGTPKKALKKAFKTTLETALDNRLLCLVKEGLPGDARCALPRRCLCDHPFSRGWHWPKSFKGLV